MSTKLFVGGLPWAMDNDRLKEVFAEFGDVADARIILDRETGRSRGFGFVTYADPAGAEKGLELDGKEVDGRRIRVDRAQEKERPARGRPRGDGGGAPGRPSGPGGPGGPGGGGRDFGGGGGGGGRREFKDDWGGGGGDRERDRGRRGKGRGRRRGGRGARGGGGEGHDGPPAGGEEFDEWD